jgi:2-C-methyl-D-erythritol 2,4-cyclodiphosphate synthase
MAGAADRSSVRVGIGYDAHRFAAGRPLVLGGVRIDHSLGLAGHSDADVLTHAVMDALLGAAALGDIGGLFPDDDPAYAGADSLLLLADVGVRLAAAGWRVVNIDAVVVCQEPRLAGYREAMCANLAAALKIDADCVGAKGTTTERMGFQGRGEGISASAVCLLERVVSP